VNKKISFPVMLIVVLFSILLTGGKVSAAATNPEVASVILYVKPDGVGNCTTWADACGLQAALSNAVFGDEIRVAAGTYKPGTSRSDTFQLKSGVAIYGGFPAAGGETRNWEVNLTILSGAISSNPGNNSYHVVTGSGVNATSILDGFTITGGNANSNYPNNYGGGIYNIEGSPALTNIKFVSNNSSRNGGGGMYNLDSAPVLTNVTFESNTGNYGGAMYNANSNPTLINVSFLENSALSDGGAIYSTGGNLTLTTVNFTSNGSYRYGGAMFSKDCNSDLTNISFSLNSGKYGGAMYNSGGNATLDNVTFSQNSVTYDGGAIYNSGINPTITNVTFSQNNASLAGGAMYNSTSNPILTNVTFFSNTANYGGGLYNSGTRPAVTNAIFWGNTPDQINGGIPTVTFSDVQGGFDGEGNINVDPLLGPLANNGGYTKTHALGASSPAIDAGSPSLCPGTDQRGYVRPMDGNDDGSVRCDMGAYEYGSIIATFPLTVSTIGGGTVTVSPQKPLYDWGEVVVLTPSANFDWVFTGWGGDRTGTANPLYVTITGATNITATFVVNEFTITVSVDPASTGSVTIEPMKDVYHYGDLVTFTAIPNIGSSFGSWSGDYTSTLNPLKISITGNTNLVANFVQAEYVLDVVVLPPGSGSVSKNPAQNSYHYGDVVTLTPVPSPGWLFSGWSGGASGLDNPLTITMTGDISINANFTAIEYTLEVAIDPIGSGTVVVVPDQATYHYGDSVTLTGTATESPYWDLSYWSGDVSSTDNPLTITITGDTSITAHFSNQFRLTIVANPADSGTVTVDPVQANYIYGDQVELTPVAKTGWTFTGWSGDASGSDNPLNYTMVGNADIIANFKQVSFYIYLPTVIKKQ